MAIPETKVFSGNRFLRNRWEHYKKDAKKSAKILRQRGFKVRITEEAGGYRLWTRLKGLRKL